MKRSFKIEGAAVRELSPCSIQCGQSRQPGFKDRDPFSGQKPAVLAARYLGLFDRAGCPCPVLRMSCLDLWRDRLSVRSVRTCRPEDHPGAVLSPLEPHRVVGE